MNGNTSTEALWDQIAPELFRQMVEVFANAGRGVAIVPENESKWEEDGRVER